MFAIIPGLLTGFSLIIAIGAQNAFVIRQGLTKKYVLLTVLICSFSDALLIILGASGLGALIKSNAKVLEFVRWFGVARTRKIPACPSHVWGGQAGVVVDPTSGRTRR